MAAFAGHETFCRRPMDVVLDFTVSGEKLFGRGIHKLERRPQSLAVNQADNKALHACRIGVPAGEFLSWDAGSKAAIEANGAMSEGIGFAPVPSAKFPN